MTTAVNTDGDRHYRDALNEILRLRHALAYESQRLTAHTRTLTRQQVTATQVDELRQAAARMDSAARGSLYDAYANPAHQLAPHLLTARWVPTCLTREAWEHRNDPTWQAA